MTTIMEQVKQLLAQKELMYMEGEQLVKFDVEGEHGSWQTFIRVVEDEPLVVVYSLLSYKVAKENAEQMALTLTQINSGLKVGNFELNLDNGEVLFKTYQEFLDEEVLDKWIDRAIQINIYTMDHYLTQIIKAAVTGSE